MTPTASIDFETRSTVDLRETGVYPYAKHKHTDIWCMAWSVNESAPQIWRPGMPLPQPLLDHIAAGGEVRAWNAQFERILWREIMVRRYKAPKVPHEQWVCTMAEANAMGLPSSLDQCAKVLGLVTRKDTEGYALMLRMCRPRSLQADGTPIWWEVDEKIERLCAYCQQDVRTETAAVKALRRLVAQEREIYLLDQSMNDYGIRVDTTLVRAAMRLADEAINRANAALTEITKGEVTAVTNHQALSRWAGVDSVAKPAMVELLSSDLDPDIRAALVLRQEAGKSSVAKLEAMLACADPDDEIVRGLLMYHGATTGRWAGKLVQPHNFPRGTIDNVEAFIPDILAGNYERIDMIAPVLHVISSLLRAMLTARPGHLLMAGDFSAIEARVLNWLANEEEILTSFRMYDDAVRRGDKEAKRKYDPYIMMAARFGSTNRQAGKAAELGCGFQMGPDRFVTAAWDVYQVRVTAEESKTAVDAYRASHPNVKDMWWDFHNSSIAAVKNPGKVFLVGGRKNIKFVKLGSYLYMVLPSGRPLCYAAPRIVQEPPPWGGEPRDALHYSGFETSPTGARKQWGTLRTYGGHLVENAVQAIARDLMAEALLRMRGTNYHPLWSVHDEIVAEVKEGEEGSIKEFESLLTTLPQWAGGCPVSAEAWQAFRYRK